MARIGDGLSLSIPCERREELGNTEVALGRRCKKVIFGVLYKYGQQRTYSEQDTYEVGVKVRIEDVLRLTCRGIS